MSEKEGPIETLEEIFNQRMQKLRADLTASGLSVDELCEIAEVGRAYMFRYNRAVPLSVRLFDKLEHAMNLVKEAQDAED